MHCVPKIEQKAKQPNSMRIKIEMIEKIKGNLGLRKELINVLGISRTTMHNYLESNDDQLTKAASLNAIAKHYNCSPNDLLEETIAA